MSADLVPDQRLRLPDGRMLGFCVYGEPAGMPVVFLHGTPGSRLQIAFAHEVCRGLGVALIAPDRWGYGLSEAPRDVVLSAYADDMAALMDHLGHARFCIGGVSGGAPYAAAVAACLVSRVLAVAFVSPVGPIADAGLGQALSRVHRFNFTILPRYPRVMTSGLPRLSLERATDAMAGGTSADVAGGAHRQAADCPARSLQARTRQLR